jgi:hypothetical protein
MRFELLITAIIWFTSNTFINFSYVIGRFSDGDGTSLTLKDLTYRDFVILSLRSTLLILVTCIKPIYDSYNEDN